MFKKFINWLLAPGVEPRLDKEERETEERRRADIAPGLTARQRWEAQVQEAKVRQNDRNTD